GVFGRYVSPRPSAPKADSNLRRSRLQSGRRLKMLTLCAGCCRDGESGYPGEREPLDNPETTHGVCPSHKNQLLESLPSRSFPDTEVLIVVRREHIALYGQLEQVFAALPGVKVLLDRRGSDRRVGPCP